MFQCNTCGVYHPTYDSFINCWECKTFPKTNQTTTQTKETTMENNNENSVSEVKVMYTQAHVDQLHTTITEQIKEIDILTKQSQFRLEDLHRFEERYKVERERRLIALSLAYDLFKEMLENDEDTLDTYSDIYEKFVNIGMDGFTKEVEFVLSYIVTVSGTAQVPWNSDFSSYDSSFIDINVDEDNFSGELLDACTEISMDVEVEERDRSRSWELTEG